MPKRIRQKDLKQDAVAEAVTEVTSRAWHEVADHRNLVLGIAGGLLAIVVVGSVAAWWMRERTLEAAAALGEVQRKSENLEKPSTPGTTGPVPTWAEMATEYATVAEAHEGTTAGNLARFHQGVALLRAGQGAEAAKVLDELVDDEPRDWATPHALSALAAAREASGDVDGARQALEELRDGDWRSYPKAAALMQLGTLHERQGDEAAARSAYELLADGEEHAESPYASQAQQRLEALGKS